MKGLDSNQIEQLKQIGDYLLRSREHQEISLEKVARQTFIPHRLLRALELGEIERLPEPVYVKGFIRRYADAIGLDGVEIADAFDFEPTAPTPTVAETPTESANVAPEPLVSASRSRGASAYPEPPQTTQYAARSVPEPTPTPANSPETRAIPYRPYLIAGAVAIAVIGAIALVSNALKPATNTASNPNTTSQTTTSASPSPAPSTAASVAPSPTATNPASPQPTTASTGPVQVAVSLTEPSWISVVADGQAEPEFEGMMDKGQTATWTAQNNLILRIGNAGGVLTSYNQGQAKTLGATGEVIDVTFSKDEPTPDVEVVQ